MPEVIRFAKGTASEHLNFTGENGEITLICDDTPNRKVTGVIRLHDGQTVGGIPFGGSQLLNDMHDVNAANTIEFQVMTVDANGQFYFANTVETIADGTISGDKIYGGTISTSAAVFEGSSANAIVRITQTGSGNALVVEDSANPDSTPFVVNSSGNVGIGTNSPLSTSVLDVNASGKYFSVQSNLGSAVNPGSDYGLHVGWNRSGGSGETNIIWGTGVGGNPVLTFATWDGSTYLQRMTIDSSGNVGIKTSPNPTASLDVLAGTNQRFMVRELGTGAVVLDAVNATNSAYQMLITNGSQHILRTNATERMRIDSSGYVIIGNNGVFSETAVNIRLSQNGQIYCASNNVDAGVFYRPTSTTNYGVILTKSNVGGTNSLVGVGYANGTFAAYSDATKKKNITDARSYLDDIKRIRVRKYNWITDEDDAPKEIGWIAQEVEEIFPGMVDTKEGSKLLKKEVFLPMLMKCVQEQQTLIEVQQSQIDTLTTKTQEQDFTIASLISRIEALESNTTP